MILYGIRSCDTCRKALKRIRADGREVTFHDLRAEPLDEGVLRDWVETVGADRIVNRRSTTWRTLSEAERAIADSEDPGAVAALLARYPTLIRRPIIAEKDTIRVGLTPGAQ
ncbi:MAG: ArsC/Spx/MgsR family protein [Rubricella sp.]